MKLNQILKNDANTQKPNSQVYLPKTLVERKDFFVNIGTYIRTPSRYRRVNKSLKGGLFTYKNLDMSDVIETKP